MVFGAGVQAGRPERAAPSSGTAVVVSRKCRPAAKPRFLPAPSRWKAEIRCPGRSAAAPLRGAVLDAGICERRTRLAGPQFRPAGCAVARAGVRRPSRGRRPSRPRDGGRTAVPGPAGGGVRPAGGCRRSERGRPSNPAPGADGRTVRASQPLRPARRERERVVWREGGGVDDRRGGGPARRFPGWREAPGLRDGLPAPRGQPQPDATVFIDPGRVPGLSSAFARAAACRRRVRALAPVPVPALA